MQLKTEERLNFYKRLAMSAVLFLLLLSVGANVFLVVTRPPEVPQRYVPPTPIADRLLLEPGAFGEVQHGFTVKTQNASGTSAVLPVGSYVVQDSILPALPAMQYLYRDQGVLLDDGHVQHLLETLNLHLPWEQIGLIPVLEKWRSSDRTLEFVLDSEKRSLTVSVLGSFGPSPEGRADDNTAIQIAKLFVDKFGINTANFGIPRIIEKTSENGSSKTYVVWSMAFAGLPLVDSMGQPVYGAQVQVGRLSRRALSGTFTLLTADALPKSSYPAASVDAIKKGLLEGGVVPAPKASGKDPFVVTYAAAQQVYILYPADREYPTYIVPGLYAAWMQPACPGCGNIQVATFIPSIDPAKFQWYAGAPVAPKPLPPVSSSVASGTGAAQ